MFVLSILHLLLVIVIVFECIKTLKKNSKSLLGFTILFFVLFDSFGIFVAPYIDLGKIVYLDNPTFLITQGDMNLYFRQVLSHWLFFLVAVFGLYYERKKNTFKDIHITRYINIYLASMLFFVLGMVFYVKYFIMGPGMNILLETKLFFSSTKEAIAHRVEARNLIELRQGSYLALIASTILFPISTVLFLLSKQGSGRFIYILICMGLSGMYAFQTRQKGPLLAVVIIYIGLIITDLYYSRLVVQESVKKNVKILFLIFVLFVFMGSVFYSINFGLSFADAVESLFMRTLIIPGATETNFFAVFPNIFPYRGLYHIFNIPFHSKFTLDDSITIYDVAYAATGIRFSSNASFLAVAWSGAGYLGVFIASVILVLILFFIDESIKKLDVKIAMFLIVTTVPACMVLVSGSFLSYVSNGGIIIPLIVMLIIRISAPINLPVIKY